MENLAELEKLSPEKCREILSKTVAQFSSKFSFPGLTKELKKEISTSFSNVLESNEYIGSHVKGLELIRILCRDSKDIDILLSERLVRVLVNYSHLEDAQDRIKIPKIEEAIEAEKALSNALFQSNSARKTFISAGAMKNLCERLKYWGDKDFELDTRLREFDLRLSFIVPAICAEIRLKCREEYGTMEALINIISVLTKDCYPAMLTQEEAGLIETALKALFNLTMDLNKKKSLSHENKELCRRLGKLLNALLLGKINGHSSEDLSLKENVVNLLTTMPSETFEELVPPVTKASEDKENAFEGHDIKTGRVLLDFLHLRLRTNKGIKNCEEPLNPILVAMCEMTKSNRILRKYMRQEVLPPMKKEVLTKPEEGETLRNLLVRCMTSVTDVKELAAEFLFILCKSNTDRLIKYTGFGNAAGLLANRGLLGGKITEVNPDDSPDEDSETEEYLEVKDKVNPVVGFCEPPKPDPMEGMSEEQKEYEAVQLLQHINKLMDQGVIKPAKVDEKTGELRPVEHVLELAETALKDKNNSVTENQTEDSDPD